MPVVGSDEALESRFEMIQATDSAIGAGLSGTGSRGNPRGKRWTIEAELAIGVGDDNAIVLNDDVASRARPRRRIQYRT